MNLLRYFVSKKWYPHLEAEVYNLEGFSVKPKLITDIDALALAPTNFGELSLILGDCKTLKNQSPISRALWLKGLMDNIGSQRGMVVLDKTIEPDHKFAAANINVTLLSVKDFELYVKCTSDYYRDISSAICNQESWDNYYNLPKRFPELANAVSFVKNDFWNLNEFRLKFRNTIGVLTSIRQEINPEHKEHIALVADFISLFSIAINTAVCRIFNQYLIPETKDQLSNDLKMLIWGGVDNYQQLNSLYRRLNDKENAELLFPQWNNLVQLIRQCLDYPYATSDVPLLMREIAFSYLETEKVFESDYAKILAHSNMQAAKFAVLITTYVCRATGIPKEFGEILTNHLMHVQS